MKLKQIKVNYYLVFEEFLSTVVANFQKIILPGMLQ